MEYLMNADDKPCRSKDKEIKPSEMQEWEVISVQERMKYACGLIDVLARKCNDRAMISILRCFVPNGEMEYNLESIVKKIKQIKIENVRLKLYQLMCMLDPNGEDAFGDKQALGNDTLTTPALGDAPRRKLTYIKQPWVDAIATFCDVILIKLKNILPQKCGGCRKWYAAPHGLVPAIDCRNCNRGRHDCRPSPQRKQWNNLAYFWFCVACGYDLTVSKVINEDKRRGHRIRGKSKDDVDMEEDHYDDDDDMYGYLDESDLDGSGQSEDESAASSSSEVIRDRRSDTEGTSSDSEYDSDDGHHFHGVYEKEEAIKKVLGTRDYGEMGAGGNTGSKYLWNPLQNRRSQGSRPNSKKISDGHNPIEIDLGTIDRGKQTRNQVKGKREENGSNTTPGLTVTCEDVFEAMGRMSMHTTLGPPSAIMGKRITAVMLYEVKETFALPISTITNNSLKERTLAKAFTNGCGLGARSVAVAGMQQRNSSDVRFLTNPNVATLKKGRGGRSSFSGTVATIFGASGFMGRYVCNRLGKNGTQMIIPYRGDHYDVRPLKLAGDLGQVLFLPYHLCDDETIRKAVKHSNIVINLVGRDWETRNFSFHKVHVEGAQRLARISKEMGVERFIHMSSLNSNIEHEGYLLKGGSQYLKTKGLSEEAVRDAFPEAIVFRPSDVYGQEDRFLRYYIGLWRHQGRWLPLPKAGKGIFKQPLHVGDMAQGIANAMYDPEAVGKTYEAVGPRRYELCELVDWFHRVMRKDENYGYKSYDMKWDLIFQMRARITEFCPNWPVNYLTRDKIEREAVSDTLMGLPTLEDLGVNLTKMEDRMHWELRPWRASSYYDEELGEFAAPKPPTFISAS